MDIIRIVFSAIWSWFTRPMLIYGYSFSFFDVFVVLFVLALVVRLVLRLVG